MYQFNNWKNCEGKEHVSLSPTRLLLCLSYQVNQVYFSPIELSKVHHVHSKPAWPLTEQVQTVKTWTSVASPVAGLLPALGPELPCCILVHVSSNSFFSASLCKCRFVLVFLHLLSGFSLLGWVSKFKHRARPSRGSVQWPERCSCHATSWSPHPPSPGFETFKLPGSPLWLYLSPGPSLLS